MKVNRFSWEQYRPTLEEYVYVCGFIQRLKNLGVYDAFVELLKVNGKLEYWHYDKLTRRAVIHYIYKRLASYRKSRSVDLVYDAVLRSRVPQRTDWWLEISKAIPIFKRRELPPRGFA